MHGSESETFVLKTVPEQISDQLKDIGVEADAKEITTDEVEHDDYYGRFFSHAPRMVTNKGCLTPNNCNIDVIQIIQKG